MATFSNGMTETEIERAKKSDDKEYWCSEYVECPKCGNNEKITTYYPAISSKSSTCVNCLHSW